MKRLTITALLGGQLLAAAQPAMAANLAQTQPQRMGAFAGFSLRLPLDGARRQPIRAGLALAPTMSSPGADGAVRTRIGEGLEFGVTGRQPLRLTLAGQDVRRLGAAQDNGQEQDGEEQGGPSTLGWVAIGAGALILVTATAGYFVFEEMMDCDPGDDCS
jgi:hypothetical protein